MARIDTRDGRAVSRASECEFLTRETRPMLTNCPNNDTCPLWFGNTFWGFGDNEIEGPDIKEARELFAQEKLEERKADFRGHEDSYGADNDNSTEYGSNETSEIDPDDLLYGDVVEDTPHEADAKTSEHKVTVQEHEEPVTPFFEPVPSYDGPGT
ncbi:hypothetical protein FBEOM_9463 [Fusarium beomiforme]|uniref:Uncharacterized protein n=1 Tax=Fusarium beomiforme TaxID=44412 RepID=A0A9P5DVV2_9HYPO|nr:hypothetical protein FBEOM_9463 [Fusarium beomiforme]